MDKKDIKKVVLAYSGGLDTSIIIPWLKENYNNCEVIAVSGNVGQADELEGLEEKALKTGASKLYVEDLTDEFVDEYVIPTVKAGALYEEYMLGTSFARPVIAKRIVEIALKEGADAICHGCTGKGNDQVRFELTIKAFAPDMPIIAPWREWSIKSREEEIEYAEAHNVPLKINRETNYSKDKNLWHLSHEGLDLEDAGNEPLYEKEGFLEMGVSPLQAPDKPTYITLDFEKGVPVAFNEEKMSAKEIIYKLNEVGGANGIGLLDIVENRLVGMKCRGVYETPGGAILYFAHQYLETLCLDKMTMHKKQELAVTFADLVYNGQWFTPLREALSAFVDKTQETVTGKVRIKLYKGNMIKAGAWSDYSLYSEEIATFGEDHVYNQADATGFINLFGLPIKVQAQVNAAVNAKKDK
ncbi:MAG: argininosuccinate synthase [Clostridia bacterium]|nr:argininosuccinate synthase [Clostridia bacterium]